MRRRTQESEMADLGVIEIRLLGIEDETAVARLAELDTAETPPSPILGAIVDGRLVAAHSLVTRQSIADPFRPTAELLALLAERAKHAGPRGRGRALARRVLERFGGGIPADPEAVR
jgi:hypothetical protein